MAAPLATTVIGSTDVFGFAICFSTKDLNTGEKVGPPTKIREVKDFPSMLFRFKTSKDISIAF